MSSSSGGEFEAARSLLEALKERSVALDKRLSATQRAESLAFAALIQNRLEPATTYSNWCEWESFSKHMRVCRPIKGAGSLQQQSWQLATSRSKIKGSIGLHRPLRGRT